MTATKPMCTETFRISQRSGASLRATPIESLSWSLIREIKKGEGYSSSTKKSEESEEDDASAASSSFACSSSSSNE